MRNSEIISRYKNPWDRFFYWIRERESIRLKKEAGESKPWTENEILQRFKFCNVRRLDDRVSRWLMKNWYTPNLSHPNMITACTLARFLNNPDSLEDVGFPNRWSVDRVAKKLQQRSERGDRNFSGAYLVTGSLGGSKIEQVVYKIVDPLHKDNLKLPGSLQETVEMLSGRLGIGSFLAGQIACDLRWATHLGWTWNDSHRYAPMGPGSRRGLNRLHNRLLNAPIKKEQWLEELGHVISTCQAVLPESITQRLEAIDYQNCLCELDKFERTLWESRRPKQRYPGV